MTMSVIQKSHAQVRGELVRDSSENMYEAIVGSWRCKPLPSTSVSDNLLVVQLSMAHLKV